MNIPYQKELTYRYLLWAYKTTRESFERIERKTTQLKVDEFIAKRIKKSPLPLEKSGEKQYLKHVAEFDLYIASKKTDEIKLKYDNHDKKKYHPHYSYLLARLSAIEVAIKSMLGVKVLKKIRDDFEVEFKRRIMENKDH